jgi:hypothetical protein
MYTLDGDPVPDEWEAAPLPQRTGAERRYPSSSPSSLTEPMRRSAKTAHAGVRLVTLPRLDETLRRHAVLAAAGVIQQRAEQRRGVEPGHAHPADAAVETREGRGRAVTDQAEVGQRWVAALHRIGRKAGAGSSTQGTLPRAAALDPHGAWCDPSGR